VRSRSRARDRSAGDKRLVGFVVGDVHYALEIERVREIVNPTTTSALPQMPPAVVGVTDHRGEVVPIVDARRHFGLASVEPSRATKWILLETQGQLLGLVVDRVTEVFGSSAPPREPPPAMGSTKARGVSWVASYGEELAFVLDVDRFAALVASVVEATVDPRALGSDAPRARVPSHPVLETGRKGDG
jgi:purine-binding chemotaxis protein CheW